VAEPIRVFSSTVIPIDAENVDTDQIVPARYLKVTDKAGLADALFRDWRFEEDGSLKDPPFILDQAGMAGRAILLVGDNFGAGSSREHAPWALLQYGFQAVIAPSFADIFFNNSFKNGLLLIKLDAKTVDRLFKEAAAQQGYRLAIDLADQSVTTPGGESIKFEIDPFRKHCLMNGLDEIGLTLEHADKIKAFEAKRREQQPWLFN